MILCCGEALIDMLPRESAAGEACFAPHAGGAVFNTAIALGRLGAPAGFFSGIASDMFGQMLRDGLAASQVDASLALVSDRPCTIAFVKLVNGQASYAFYDEATAGRMLSVADLPAIPAQVGAMFLGGIYLAKEPAGTAYEALMTREAPARAMMLDPNIRPGFITDAAAYRARVARMIALADVVKLSDEDLHWLEGAGDVAAIAAAMLTRGPKAVLVTRGAEGASAFTAGFTVSVPAQRVAVVDTVGAGDTFNAGVLAALHEAGALTKAGIAALDEDGWRAALSMGIAAAAVTVSRAGANPPWRREL